jgi:acyl transferase domain-containing protein
MDSDSTPRPPSPDVALDRREVFERALATIDRLQRRLDEAERARRDPIAVVGIGCRFPAADGPAGYWQLLSDGRDAVRKVPTDRFDVDAYYDPDPSAPGKTVVRTGGFLDAVDGFDPHFFGIAPREAVRMDPQHRLFLEVAWEALEHAGQAPAGLRGTKTGVFLGITMSEYSQLETQVLDIEDFDGYVTPGVVPNVAAGRLSHILGLHGPSMAVDTACSSSLVATHLAVQSLRVGDSDLALAGGVNVMLLPETFVAFSKLGMMSPTGRCRTFDAGADGFVRGEGCGVVVLKRLADATADGDGVLAVIRGSAVNQDGPSSGLSVPNGLSQQAVIEGALKDAGLEPADVAYLEAHGTATTLGDPIEAEAAAQALRPRGGEPLLIGSVKTNIGHLESASGIAGLIKAVLAVYHGEIPPHLHLEKPSEHIDWQSGRLSVPIARTPFPTGKTRVAGVSSFGYSGTNAHVLVAEAPAAAAVPSPGERGPHLLPLSAKRSEALVELAARYERRLGEAGVALLDVCRTASLGRSHFQHRLAVVALDADQARAALAAFRAGEDSHWIARGTASAGARPRVRFAFGRSEAGGVAESRPADGLGLAAALERCQAIASSRGVTSPEPVRLLALHVALVELWRSYGIEPTAVGGETDLPAAGWAAGSLTLEQAVALAVETDASHEGAPDEPRVSVAAGQGDEEVVLDISPAGASRETVLRGLAALYAAGAEIDWPAVAGEKVNRIIDLPTYPFQRERYWVPGARRGRGAPRKVHPLLGSPLRSPALAGAVFEAFLSPDDPRYLGDHRVQGKCVLPATAYVEMALAAVAAAFGDQPRVLEDLALNEALVLPDGQGRRVQAVLTPTQADGLRFRLYSAGADDSWTLHGEGQLRVDDAAPDGPDLAAARRSCTDEVDTAEFYGALDERGLGFGPAFRGITRLWAGKGEAIGEAELPASAGGDVDAYRIHPALLDACWQVFGAAWSGDVVEDGELVMPVAIDRLRLHRAAGERLVAHARLRPGPSAATLTGDLTLWSPSGELVAEVEGLRLRRLGSALLGGEERWREWLYEVVWEPALPLTRGPAPAALCEAAIGAATGAAAATPLRSDALETLERAASAYAARAFVELGFAPAPGARMTADEIAAQLGIVPRHRRLLDRLLAVLTQDGSLRDVGAAWKSVRPPAAEDPGPSLEALAGAVPEHAAEAHLLMRCGASLASVLRGADPLELLFPGGSLEEARRLYRDSGTARAPNAAVAAAAAAVAKETASDRLRVLEIGAGTGGTTEGLLAVLPDVEYVFTDVSPRFLAHAREHLAAPAAFELLDIERDPAGQGFGGRRFDLVVAANVLHATAEVRQTLEHVRTLLAPGGVCLFVEGIRDRHWIDLTFGLTEGWWRFADPDLRATSPLLPAERWETLLAEAGFAATGSVSAGDAGAAPFAQAVIVGVAPAAARLAIVADRTGTAARLATRAEQRGIATTIVPSEREAIDAALAGGAGQPATLVHLGALDAATAQTTAAQAEDAVEEICAGALAAVQGGVAAGVSRLVLVTSGAQPAGPGRKLEAPLQAALWGLGRVVALEHPELRRLSVDVDAGDVPGDAELDMLLDEVLAADGEDEVAHRGGERHVSRLARCSVPPGTPSGPVRLVAMGGGSLDGLELRPSERRPPGPGEVEIAVRATALNFRDVLTVLDMYPGEQPPLGGECGGEVVAVGPGVEGLAVGDTVAAIATDAFSSFVTTSAELAVPKPDRLTIAEAATVPAAFVTAAYALEHVAGLKRGDRVLVHAAAGGVGLAAVQLALRAGAQVFATAGSEEKRRLLAGLGIEHVMSSRNTDFADEVLAVTAGRGVDVVLNSLAGDLLEASVRVLADDGRFVELGKRGIWDHERFASAKPRAFYAALDVAALAEADPALVGSILRDVVDRVSTGELEPLPLTTFPLGSASEAFRTMAQARHVGKLVLLHGTPAVRPDRSYLVTGGLAGIGLASAERLVQRGARHLLLVGRSEPGPEASAAIAGLREAGAQIRVITADASSEEALARILEETAETGPPLGGVIHSAGVLDDGSLVQQAPERFARVLAPKVRGATALEQLTTGLDLGIFCLYSSGSAVLGSPGQANHAAANAVLDALARRLRARGCPAISIGWGPWSERGAAAGEEVAARLAARGIDSIRPVEGLEALDRLLDAATGDSVPAHVAVLPVRFADYLRSGSARRAFFGRIETEPSPPRHPAPAPELVATASGLRAELESMPASRRRARLATHVKSRALRVLGLDGAIAVDPAQPLNELGLDSLLAVELRNVLGADLALERPLPATLVFDYPTIDAIVDYLGRDVLSFEQERSERDGLPAAAAELEQLSEDEAEAVLLDELEALERGGAA